MSIGFDRNSGKQPAPPSRDRRSASAIRPFAPVAVLSREDLATLAPYRKRVLQTLWTANNMQSALASELNNAPNTALGLAHGLTGHVVGSLKGTHPRISRTRDGIEFIQNPGGGVGAVTIGRATIYRGDPYDRSGRENPYDPGAPVWYKNGKPTTEDGNPIHLHEAAHRPQGEILGLAYLPSNIAGGLLAKARGKKWHDPSNWNETGPQKHPPRPWPERR